MSNRIEPSKNSLNTSAKNLNRIKFTMSEGKITSNITNTPIDISAVIPECTPGLFWFCEENSQYLFLL